MSRITQIVRHVSIVGLLATGVAGEAAAQDRSSPLGYARAEVGGYTIEIQYGRPAMRGRTIFGGLVPYGQVWRTGANEATHLRTPVALLIGGARVPAGEYTLFTIPAEDEWTLIVSSQTGQWGTAYSSDYDHARVPMSVETLGQPVERFTIQIVVEGDEGAIVLDWESTRARVGFRRAGGG